MSATGTANNPPTLTDLIRGQIKQGGPMSFARFMELALYEPRWGYYTAPNRPERIGRRGDFFTSVSVGSIFGELMALQFAEFWELMGRPVPFTLVELGAHRGQLSTDVRTAIQRLQPEFAAAARLISLDYPGELPADVTGCIFSNELVDSFPVHLITRQQNEWKELMVVENGGQLEFQARPVTCSELRQEVNALPLPPIEGYVTEVHLEARRWMNRMARSLARGFLLTIDYGYPAEDYYAPHRKEGTLLCYHQHRTNNSPLVRVGEQDITSHVNFTALAREGAAAGLSTLGFTDQSRFIAALLEKDAARWSAPVDPHRLAQLKTLLHPELMGRAFKLLIQQRGMDTAKPSGLKFARDTVC